MNALIQYLPSISPSSLTHSPSPFCCHCWPSVFCCGDDHCCHQRSQMKGGLYPHLCPSFLTPLTFSPSLSLISHLSPRLNNEQVHLLSETRVFRTYQQESQGSSNTHDENSRCKCLISVQGLSRVFQSFSTPTNGLLTNGVRPKGSCLNHKYHRLL